MAFEWDEAKNRAMLARNRVNTTRHGIDFETARRIFDGPVLTRRDRRRDCGEERHVGIGRVDAAMIVVAHTGPDGGVQADIGATRVAPGETDPA